MKRTTNKGFIEHSLVARSWSGVVLRHGDQKIFAWICYLQQCHRYVYNSPVLCRGLWYCVNHYGSKNATPFVFVSDQFITKFVQLLKNTALENLLLVSPSDGEGMSLCRCRWLVQMLVQMMGGRFSLWAEETMHLSLEHSKTWSVQDMAKHKERMQQGGIERQMLIIAPISLFLACKGCCCFLEQKCLGQIYLSDWAWLHTERAL